MSQPKGYVDPEFLRFIGNQFNHIKQRSYVLMQIQLGHKVLDLGCGPGTDTIPLAPLVGVNGQVIGADYDGAMITVLMLCHCPLNLIILIPAVASACFSIYPIPHKLCLKWPG